MTYETLQYIGSFDLEIVANSLGDIVIPHGGAMYEFFKLDSPYGQRGLNLKFKVLPQSGSLIDAGDVYGGCPNRFDYIWGIYQRNRVQGIKPIIVTGPDDVVDRFYYFTEAQLSFNMFSSKMFSSGVKLMQINLPGITGPGDPLAQPNPLSL
jgi:hypothetical protein